MEFGCFSRFTFTDPIYVEEPPLEAFLKPVTVTKEQLERERSLETRIIKIDLSEFEEDITDDFDPDVTIDYDIHSEFSDLLGEVSKAVGHSFYMDKRNLRLVPRDELKPKSRQEEDALVKTYGEYIRGGGIGDCDRHEDGTFTLRVGVGSGWNSKSTVKDITAHEYGHTLGRESHPEIIFEEIKAYAFASLCERVELGVTKTSYEELSTDLHPDQVHDTATHRVGELLRAGIPEAAILSHLTGEMIGSHTPDSYLKFL